MKIQFNFQINPLDHREAWERVPVYRRKFTDRVAAIHFAERLARLYKAEVRLSEGTDPLRESGAYFR
ncbi:hypothetical protein LL912_12440 [Niabella sp. CC-SYL272]|uniref:hypothetical protein n=1 Tax=Niabella agricola TaxID=2891571 RepID=UPI001F3CC918|nr:hypothetical protein [Niabella agricola]MCF3109581.1 hypothetical protein [Niabella agricola]